MSHLAINHDGAYRDLSLKARIRCNRFKAILNIATHNISRNISCHSQDFRSHTEGHTISGQSRREADALRELRRLTAIVIFSSLIKVRNSRSESWECLPESPLSRSEHIVKFRVFSSLTSPVSFLCLLPSSTCHIFITASGNVCRVSDIREYSVALSLLSLGGLVEPLLFYLVSCVWESIDFFHRSRLRILQYTLVSKDGVGDANKFFFVFKCVNTDACSEFFLLDVCECDVYFCVFHF